MSNSKKKINKYLSTRRVFNSNEPNIISIPGPNFPNGKYLIKNNKDFEKFLDLYIDCCFNSKINTYLLEPPFNINKIQGFDDSFKEHNIIKIDLDFKYNYDHKLELSDKAMLLKHKYTDIHTKKIINIYINILKKYVNLNENIIFPNENSFVVESMDFVLLERKTAYINTKKDSKIVKDGIHILCPTFVFPISILHKVREDMLKNENFIEIIDEIGQLNKINDVLDSSVISTNAWFLYGSGKPYSEPYEITQVYKFKQSKKTDTEELGGDKIFDNNKTIKFVKMKDAELTNYTENKKSLVYKLSNFGIKQAVPPINDAILINLQSEVNVSSSSSQQQKFDKVLGITRELNATPRNIKKPESTSITLDFLNKLLSCIDDNRSTNYDDWWKIGQALYNIDWNKGFFAFVEFSRKSVKFDLEGCKKIWRLFERNYINNKYQFNIKYLKELAFLDNKKLYIKISELISLEILNGIITVFKQPIYKEKIGDSTLSKEIKKIIDNESHINFVSIENGQWYYYENHKWVVDTEGNKIKLYLKNTILAIFIKFYKNCRENIKSIKDEINRINSFESTQEHNPISSMDDLLNSNTDELSDNISTLEKGRKTVQELKLNQSDLDDSIDIAKKLVNYLENSTKRTTLVKELATEFYDPDFYKLLDSNPNVFHCNNGIFDLETCIFRDGVPDDMISISSKNNYIIDEVRFSDPEYQKYDSELNDFLDKIFPNPDMKEYMMNIWAMSLSGKTYIQTFNVCSGSGSNGKSVNFELLSEVFGDYYCVASPALLTKSRSDANAASPAVAVLLGKRIVCTEEPDEGESIKTGVMKEAVSGTQLSCRELHKPQKTFTPQYMLFFNCNDKPEIGSTDEGTWRRIRVAPYVSKFCDYGDARLENPTKYKNHFIKDYSIKTKFANWKEVFLNELIIRYKKLKENEFKIPLPSIVQNAIDDYKSGYNIYEGFKKDSLIKTAGERLTIGDGFNSFKQYTDQCNHKIGKITRNVFITEMTRVIGKLKGNNKYWKDWAVIEDYEDDDDVEEELNDSESEAE